MKPRKRKKKKLKKIKGYAGKKTEAFADDGRTSGAPCKGFFGGCTYIDVQQWGKATQKRIDFVFNQIAKLPTNIQQSNEIQEILVDLNSLWSSVEWEMNTVTNFTDGFFGVNWSGRVDRILTFQIKVNEISKELEKEFDVEAVELPKEKDFKNTEWQKQLKVWSQALLILSGGVIGALYLSDNLGKAGK